MADKGELMGSSEPIESQRTLPLRAAVVIDAAIAITLFGLSLYHFTHEGWRSGVSELVSALSLLAAACLVRQPKAAVINLAVAVLVFGLSLYHFTHGGGWGSGTTELVFTIVLVTVAWLIWRARTPDRGAWEDSGQQGQR